MIGYTYQLQQKMIQTLQLYLKPVRQILGFGVQEFADLLGLTRQTINNLETQKNRMSPIQYIAISSLIDYFTDKRPELLPSLQSLLRFKFDETDEYSFEMMSGGSLVKKWIQCFANEVKQSGIPLNQTQHLLCSTDEQALADRYRIFLDDTILQQAAFLQAIRKFSIAMRESQNKFIVPLKAVESLQMKLGSSDSEKVNEAKAALQALVQLKEDSLVEIRGEKGDSSVVTTLVSVLAKFKRTNRLALLTENPALAQQVLALNNDTMGGFPIRVFHISKTGTLEDVETEKIKQPSVESGGETLLQSTISGWSEID